MSVDALQEKIRKKKNALMVDLTVFPEELPPHLLADSTPAEACGAFCRELMETLKNSVPALRFDFGAFAMMDGGISVLKGVAERGIRHGLLCAAGCAGTAKCQNGRAYGESPAGRGK